MHNELHEIDFRLSALFMALVGAYLVPSWVYILLCIFLVLTDSFFGILSIKKRGDTFSFRRLIFKGIILKFAVYFPVIIGAVKVDEMFLKPIFNTNIPLLVSLFFIFFYDMRSIWNHFRMIRGGSDKKDLSDMSKVFTWMRLMIDKIQEK